MVSARLYGTCQPPPRVLITTESSSSSLLQTSLPLLFDSVATTSQGRIEKRPFPHPKLSMRTFDVVTTLATDSDNRGSYGSGARGLDQAAQGVGTLDSAADGMAAGEDLMIE
jgi:hypothetical protein